MHLRSRGLLLPCDNTWAGSLRLCISVGPASRLTPSAPPLCLCLRLQPTSWRRRMLSGPASSAL